MTAYQIKEACSQAHTSLPKQQRRKKTAESAPTYKELNKTNELKLISIRLNDLKRKSILQRSLKLRISDAYYTHTMSLYGIVSLHSAV